MPTVINPLCSRGHDRRFSFHADGSVKHYHCLFCSMDDGNYAEGNAYFRHHYFLTEATKQLVYACGRLDEGGGDRVREAVEVVEKAIKGEI